MAIAFKRKWIWINLTVLGLVSPFLNSLYNYWGGLTKLNDVGRMFNDLPSALVHGYFLFTLGAYLIGTILVFTLSNTARSLRNR